MTAGKLYMSHNLYIFQSYYTQSSGQLQYTPISSHDILSSFILQDNQLILVTLHQYITASFKSPLLHPISLQNNLPIKKAIEKMLPTHLQWLFSQLLFSFIPKNTCSLSPSLMIWFSANNTISSIYLFCQ